MDRWHKRTGCCINFGKALHLLHDPLKKSFKKCPCFKNIHFSHQKLSLHVDGRCMHSRKSQVKKNMRCNAGGILHMVTFTAFSNIYSNRHSFNIKVPHRQKTGTRAVFQSPQYPVPMLTHMPSITLRAPHVQHH